MSPAGWRATWSRPATGACRPTVAREAKHRILDTLAAMVSGARLKPGEMAIQYVRGQGGVAGGVGPHDRHQDLGRQRRAGQRDVRPRRRNRRFRAGHQGASRLRRRAGRARHGGAGRTDRAWSCCRAVTLGYDLCCRFLLALGPDLVRATHRSAEGTSATFGSAAAAASLARLDETGMRYALSYAAQQVSGLWSWVRDTEHVEKAFDFAGMGARNGVTAAIMVQTGFTGVAGRARRRAQRARGAFHRSRSRRKWSPVWAAGSSSPKPPSRSFPSAIRFRRRWMPSSRCAASTA